MGGGDQVHGTALCFDGRGVLLRGASGSGKSDLALRLMQRGFHLIADDRVDVQVLGGEVIASPPTPLEGLLEVRGLGIFKGPFVAYHALHLVIDLVAANRIERLPEPGLTAGLFGEGDLPLVRLHAFEASAPDKVILAMQPGDWSILPV
ncbi:MAG: HPr kinase/phosphorylase [Magnetovibrionaceae bacterium]